MYRMLPTSGVVDESFGSRFIAKSLVEPSEGILGSGPLTGNPSVAVDRHLRPRSAGRYLFSTNLAGAGFRCIEWQHYSVADGRIRLEQAAAFARTYSYHGLVMLCSSS